MPFGIALGAASRNEPLAVELQWRADNRRTDATRLDFSSIGFRGSMERMGAFCTETPGSLKA